MECRVFFRRLAEGVFDEEDLIRRAHELADFVSDGAARYGFDAEKVVAVGYSNGANIAGGILLLRPGVLCDTALLRPMVPLVPETLPELKATPVPVFARNHDQIVLSENARELVALLRRAGADVTVCFVQRRSRPYRRDFETTRWLARGESQMSRIPELSRNELDADGKQLYDEILAARGNIAGPFRVWLHSPEFTRRATRLGEFLRYHTSLPPRPSELVILITARRQESEVEWAIHEPLARKAGPRRANQGATK